MKYENNVLASELEINQTYVFDVSSLSGKGGYFELTIEDIKKNFKNEIGRIVCKDENSNKFVFYNPGWDCEKNGKAIGKLVEVYSDI